MRALLVSTYLHLRQKKKEKATTTKLEFIKKGVEKKKTRQDKKKQQGEKMRKSRRAEFRKTLIEITQVLFAFLIFIVFVLAFVIQSDGIILPAWTKTFQGATPEQQAQYSAALLSVIIVISVIIVGAGIYLTRSRI